MSVSKKVKLNIKISNLKLNIIKVQNLIKNRIFEILTKFFAIILYFRLHKNMDGREAPSKVKPKL